LLGEFEFAPAVEVLEQSGVLGKASVASCLTSAG
jgi:hypothetical protein